MYGWPRFVNEPLSEGRKMGVIHCENCHAEMVRKGPRHRYCARCARDRELRRLVRLRKEEAVRNPEPESAAETTQAEVTLSVTQREVKLSNGEEFIVTWSGDVGWLNKPASERRRGGLLPLWPQKDRGFTP